MTGRLHDPLLLGGLRCAVRLAPAAVLAQLPSAQALHICKVWVINNFDCRMFRSGVRPCRRPGAVQSCREGPAWEVDACVDVVARVRCRNTGQAFLLRCADESVGVEVVFTRLQLALSVLHLTSFILRAALMHPLHRLASGTARALHIRRRNSRGWGPLLHALLLFASFLGTALVGLWPQLTPQGTTAGVGEGGGPSALQPAGPARGGDLE
ncbi:hypothetical protein QJQ45_025025 [Haematococcus lacustris]|nr:hypothetical protein QJQ45_025025 [Haematococcus lacustris]